ncbi:MAG: RluA family pseudouridine synthase [Patescibacteria group bacterium]
MSKNKFLITDEGHNKRLDIFLVEKLEISRSQAQKLIAENLVLVNDKAPMKAGVQLKKGHTVVVASQSLPNLSTAVERKRSPRLHRGEGEGEVSLTPKIISKTPDYLVIEKPTGMLTHPTMAGEAVSVATWAAKKYPGLKRVGDDPKVRPGIVHRLDKEASGLLVVARTQKMFDHLKEQFKNRTIEKEYLALVHDRVAKDWDILNFPIARSETSDRMAARPLNEGTTEGQKEAKTEFLVEKRFVNFTLLRITLHTGRMHQIRVHLLAYNHPLVGDPLYIQKKRKRAWDDKLGRLFLHSTKLSFTDLKGFKQTFESPLPPELQSFLTKLS